MKPAAFTCCGLHTLPLYRFSTYAIVTATGTPSRRRRARNAIGGTGKYAGVTGTCTYEASYLTQDRVVTEGECAWDRAESSAD